VIKIKSKIRIKSHRRFMESHLFLFELPRAHEPENRKCLEIKGAISRFMESLLAAAGAQRKGDDMG
jgi:hypothetical protein